MSLDPNLLAVLANAGFAGVAFYMMYKFATDTTEKLRETTATNTDKLIQVINDNTGTLRELKTLIEQKME